MLITSARARSAIVATSHQVLVKSSGLLGCPNCKRGILRPTAVEFVYMHYQERDYVMKDLLAEVSSFRKLQAILNSRAQVITASKLLEDGNIDIFHQHISLILQSSNVGTQRSRTPVGFS
jgi:hypothetical protein